MLKKGNKVQSNCFDEKRYLVIGHEDNNYSAARKAPVSLQSIGFLVIPTSLVGEFLQQGRLTSVQGATLMVKLFGSEARWVSKCCLGHFLMAKP